MRVALTLKVQELAEAMMGLGKTEVATGTGRTYTVKAGRLLQTSTIPGVQRRFRKDIPARRVVVDLLTAADHQVDEPLSNFLLDVDTIERELWVAVESRATRQKSLVDALGGSPMEQASERLPQVVTELQARDGRIALMDTALSMQAVGGPLAHAVEAGVQAGRLSLAELREAAFVHSAARIEELRSAAYEVGRCLPVERDVRMRSGRIYRRWDDTGALLVMEYSADKRHAHPFCINPRPRDRALKGAYPWQGEDDRTLSNGGRPVMAATMEHYEDFVQDLSELESLAVAHVMSEARRAQRLDRAAEAVRSGAGKALTLD